MPQSGEATVDKVATENPSPAPVPKHIARKFAFSVCLVVVLAMCSFWLISFYNTQNILRQQADVLGQALAEQTAARLTELVLANDLISMNVVLGSLAQAAAISEVAVLSVDDRVMASAASAAAESSPLLPVPLQLDSLHSEYRASIALEDTIAGYVRLQLDLSYIEAGLINNLLLVLGATTLILFIVALMVSLYFQTLISFPSRLLAFSLSNIRRGKIESCPEPKTNTELTELIRQYNSTAEFLARNTYLENFGERLPGPENTIPDVDLDNHETSLLAVQLANFQYLASTLPNRTLVALLNKYYFFACKVSQLYSGHVSFCADGEVLIDFADVTQEEEQAFLAICAGQLFLKLIAELAEVDNQQLRLKFHLAVHSGKMLTGVYSPLTGANNHLIGETLDYTRRLCELCPDNQLLISAASLLLAGPETRVDAVEYSNSEAADPARTYLSREPMSDYRLLIERQAKLLASLYAN